MRIYCLLFTLFSLCTINAQKSNIKLLDFYGDAMMNSFQEKNRIYAHEKFAPLLITELNLEHSFKVDLSAITGVKVLTPNDSSFRIITWEVLSTKRNNYYMIVQKSDGSFVEFNQNDEKLDIDFLYTVHNPDDWYGALYYQMKEDDTKEGKRFLLYGFKRINKFTKAKFIDVLIFDEHGIPNLGKEIFVKEIEGARDDVQTKVLIKYDANAYVNISFNEGLGMFVYDHMVKKMGVSPEQGMTSYPDGTYEGYEAKSDKYYHVDKVFNQTSATPPKSNIKREANSLFPEKEPVIKKKRK